jgi:hypothetical protein
MTEHNCYIYERGDLAHVITIRVRYHDTKITAKVVAESELEAEAWKPFENALSRRLSKAMPKPSEDRAVNEIIEEFLEELIGA